MLRGAVCSALGMGLLLVSPARAARVTDGLVLGYDFREGSGTTVGDYSGNGAALNLTIHDPSSVTWGTGSLTINAATIISSASAANVPPESTASKAVNAIKNTNEITIEAWVKPTNLILGDGRMVTLSLNSGNRNFSLIQVDTIYQTRFRTTVTGNNGASPALDSVSGFATDIQHVVYTRKADGHAAIYIDGVFNAGEAGITGDVSNWNDSYDFALGNELTWSVIDARDWLGTYYLVALYDKALSPDEVMANFQAGALAPVVPEPAGTVLAAIGLLAIATCGRNQRCRMSS